MKKGHILINRNICDNAPECGGIVVCSEIAEALFWNEKKQQVDYNADLCIACKKCADEEIGCPIGAIRFASTEEEYEQIEREIAEDTRRIEDLQVERYGASPIEECILIDELNNWLGKQDKESIVFVELFADETIQCLLHSIKAEEIQSVVNEKSKYTKVQLNNSEDIEKPIIEELPALLIYKNHTLRGKIEGYYDESMKDDFFNKVKEIVK